MKIVDSRSDFCLAVPYYRILLLITDAQGHQWGPISDDIGHTLLLHLLPYIE